MRFDQFLLVCPESSAEVLVLQMHPFVPIPFFFIFFIEFLMIEKFFFNKANIHSFRLTYDYISLIPSCVIVVNFVKTFTCVVVVKLFFIAKVKWNFSFIAHIFVH